MLNYLLEIGTEEIPAKFMPGILRQLKEHAEQKMQEQRITFESIQTLGTPRRFALMIKNVAEKAKDLQEEVRGPAKRAAFDSEGKPTKAALGFARSQGVNIEDLVVKETGNGEYIYAERQVKGEATEEALPQIVLELINSLSFPKPMRWGSLEMRFVRPIRWIVSLLNDKVIPVEIACIQADRNSRGHRFLGAQEIKIKEPLTYVEQLRDNFVMVDQEERRAECWKQIREIAATVQGTVEEDQELLEEVVHLLEWPTALMGSFEKFYLEIPEEVVITPMREHQRYFPVRSKDGKLLNKFITVRNGNADSLEIVQAGNEKVLKARLADARFFWDEDKKVKLADYLPRLEKIVFQDSLGTVADKVERIKANVEYLGHTLSLCENVSQDALRAAQLAKADLVTNMVYEFPELQGIMGRYYASLSGEKDSVSVAILEHYQPRFAGDAVPQSDEGALVSIADKLDTICGCFAIGIEPTGSQDPYALRRQAMGICQTILEHHYELSLDELIQAGLASYKGIVAAEKLTSATKDKIKEFFQGRIKNILGDQGHRYDVIDAVLASDYNSLITTIKRAEALSELKGNEDFQAMMTSFTRAYNLAKKAERIAILPEAFVDESEKVLYQALGNSEEKVVALMEQRDFTETIKVLSSLTRPINNFFDAVMIMDKDEKVRTNRLSLLAKFVELTRTVADLSKIVSAS